MAPFSVENVVLIVTFVLFGTFVVVAVSLKYLETVALGDEALEEALELNKHLTPLDETVGSVG